VGGRAGGFEHCVQALMALPRSVERLRSAGTVRLAGGLVSLAVGAALFARWGIHGGLSRDEAIYTYSGQQLAHGVPLYTSIFDPKGPLASLVAGAAATVSRGVGHNDIDAIRIAFFACSCLTVVAIYLLATRLFRSVLAGVVAAVVFASFTGFAEDALSGPDAKTPGVLAAVIAMWLMTRRQWFWAGFVGAIALLDWQPLVIYPVLAIALAIVDSPAGQRLRSLGMAVAGAAVPLAVVTISFAADGGLRSFYEAALVFPATGVVRRPETLGHRLHHIVVVVHQYYGVSGVLFWVGLLALLLLVLVHLIRNRANLRAALRAPLVLVVLVTLLGEAAYACIDFQSYPDILPLLAYPALGLGGAAAVVVRLLNSAPARVATAGVLVGLAVLTAFSWSWSGVASAHDKGIRAQGADACAIERMLGSGGQLWAMGDPAPLVMLHRRNPERFIYLGAGVDRWKVAHTPGGFDGWTNQVKAADPAVVAMNSWRGRLATHMRLWLLTSGYRSSWVGEWHVFLSADARARASAEHVTLTPGPTSYATGSSGLELPASGCT
jgi:4-amino-4-deoxy-L-arabinose transferase-like glycosyltransferase